MNPDNTLPPNGDEQPTSPYDGMNEITPTQPDQPINPDVAPVTPAPVAAPRGTGTPTSVRAILIGVIAAVVLVALIVTGVVFAKSQSTTPSASDILSHAQSAKLQDTTYTLNDNLAINFGSSATPTTGSIPSTLTFTGTGKLTKTPARNDVTIAIPFLGSQNGVEVITDGSDVYANIGNLAALAGILGGGTGTGTPTPPTPTNPTPQWYKVSLGNQPLNLLDYSHVQDAKLIGSEQIGSKNTWHLQGTLAIKGLSDATPDPGIAATVTAVATQTGASVTPVTIDLWFQQDTYFPAKIAIKFSANLGNLASSLGGLTGTPSASATPAPTNPTPSQISSDATLLFSAWNSGITITLPDPSQVTTIPTTGGNPFPSLTPTPSK